MLSVFLIHIASLMSLRNLLVHPKDRISDKEKPEVAYKISCKNCERVYVGETGRLEDHWEQE